MTKNGPIAKRKTESELGECTDHNSTLHNNANLQSPVKIHPNTILPRTPSAGCEGLPILLLNTISTPLATCPYQLQMWNQWENLPHTVN